MGDARPPLVAGKDGCVIMLTDAPQYLVPEKAGEPPR
jgi:hypothetical protein